MSELKTKDESKHGSRDLLSELMRPQTLADLFLPPNIIERLQEMMETETIMNMLFYGQHGAGKTSAARLVCQAEDWIECDAAGRNDFISLIDGFSSTVAFKGILKLCLIDNADCLAKVDQTALLKMIEKYSTNCRYLFALSDRKKLIPALQSRLIGICFDIAPDDQDRVKERLTKRYQDTLASLGISFDENQLSDLVKTYFPDLRSIANHVEFTFLHH